MSDSPARQPLSALSDDQLVDRVRSGSPKAVQALFARYQQPLLAFCRHMLGHRDRGEEAVRESFAQALGTVRMHDRPVNLRALLFAMARNRCLAMLTLEAAHDGLELDGLDPRVARDPKLRRLVAAVAGLPTDQRAALLLAQLGVHAEEEIATIVGAPRDKVAALIGQARMSVAGIDKPGDWHCAQALTELAGHDGQPRREAVRRHVADCESCQRFGQTIAQQRRTLSVALPVAATDGLSAPEPATAPRAVRRAAAATEASRGSWLNRTTAALAALGVLLVAVVGVSLTKGRGAPAPAALAPVASGARHADTGTSGGAGGSSGVAGVVHAGEADDADGLGPLARAALEARRLIGP